jgi:hypothetical protein
MMRSLRYVSIFGVILAMATGSAVLSAQGSPLAGTWKYNAAKSKYSPANLALKSSTSKFDVTGDSVRLVNDGVDAEGHTTHLEYSAKFDGKPYPVKSTVDGKPSPSQDGVTWRKIDDYTYENVAMLKGKATTTTRVTISRDGKTRTNAVTGTDAQGRTINNMVIYERQ